MPSSVTWPGRPPLNSDAAWVNRASFPDLNAAFHAGWANARPASEACLPVAAPGSPSRGFACLVDAGSCWGAKVERGPFWGMRADAGLAVAPLAAWPPRVGAVLGRWG